MFSFPAILTISGYVEGTEQEFWALELMDYVVGEFVIDMDAKYYNQAQILNQNSTFFMVVERYPAEIQTFFIVQKISSEA